MPHDTNEELLPPELRHRLISTTVASSHAIPTRGVSFAVIRMYSGDTMVARSSQRRRGADFEPHFPTDEFADALFARLSLYYSNFKPREARGLWSFGPHPRFR